MFIIYSKSIDIVYITVILLALFESYECEKWKINFESGRNYECSSCLFPWEFAGQSEPYSHGNPNPRWKGALT